MLSGCTVVSSSIRILFFLYWKTVECSCLKPCNTLIEDIVLWLIITPSTPFFPVKFVCCIVLFFLFCNGRFQSMNLFYLFFCILLTVIGNSVVCVCVYLCDNIK